jgi:hypothetical protein
VMAAIVGVFVIGVAVVALRQPYLRSLRTSVLVAVSFTLSTLLVGTERTPAVVAGALIAVAPLVAILWFQRYITALPPADFAEHELIADARTLLRRADDLDETADVVLSRLAESHPPAVEWAEVRRAVVDQIRLVKDHAGGSREVTRDEARASWQRTVDAWKAAIAARRKFVR